MAKAQSPLPLLRSAQPLVTVQTVGKPVGKTIATQNRVSLTVTGVVQYTM